MRFKPILPILLSAVCLTPVACKEKGPLEKAGDAVSDAAKQTEDFIQEGVDKAGKAVEQAYDSGKDAVSNGTDSVKNGAGKAGEAVEEFGESVKDTVTK